MTTITTHNNKEIVVIEVPDDAYDFQVGKIRNGAFICFKNRYKIPYKTSLISIIGKNIEIIGRLEKLKDNDVEGYVEKHPNLEYRNYKPCLNLLYMTQGWVANWGLQTAKESFISLLKSKGVDVEKNLLILEKQ